MPEFGKRQGITDVKCPTWANVPANADDLSRRVENTKAKGMFLVRVAIVNPWNTYR